MTTSHHPTRYIRWLLFLAVPLLLMAACAQMGGLRPIAPTVVPNQLIAGQPQLVSFTELEEDPTRYQDKVIRVSGMYVGLPVVSCMPRSGPETSWALVADGLRLDMVGFEGLVNQIAPHEMTLTVDGILRRYDGPLGCGKRPQTGILWYLELFQIIQPNPLVQSGVGPSGGTAVVPPPFPTGTEEPTEPDGEETPQGEATTGLETPTHTPTPTSAVIATASSIPTITPDIDSTTTGPGTATRTPTRTTTPTIAATTGPGGSTPTLTPSQTPTPGATVPPLPTATPGSYPGVTQTPYP